ncbi:MAG: D-glucuronyl C5-epimerase family protein [Candidatus Thorarchaeota archaeon]|nr:D-glucuronyl C5-epimerase family protein [Candidatus Thorarchaeota archaeon]
MTVSEILKRTYNKIATRRRWILKRLLIYFVVLMVAFPFVFVNRTQIYSQLLVRHDEWYERIGEDGIPVGEYGVQANVYVGPQTTARMVANSGIEYYSQMKDGNETAGEYFNNTVEWLIENLQYFYIPTQNGTIKIGHWIFDFAIWDLPKGWHQSMADAKGIQLLALAYQEYGNTTYLSAIDAITNSFTVPMYLGGNVYTVDNGLSWYPEYVVRPQIDMNYEPYLVLNGFLICLRHLNEASKILNDTKIKNIVNKGVITAAVYLPRYDSPYNWTLYHLDYPVKFADRGYHRIHIHEAQYLYENTNVSIFKYYADLWSTYTSPPFFTIEEALAPDFITFGILITTLILSPTIIIDFIQYKLRRRSKSN